MSAATVVTFDLAFIFERYLRHTNRLAPNTSQWQKINSACATIFAIIGAAGLILLTIFDNRDHNRLHNIFLGVFIVAYVISAIFICWEYQRLGVHHRQHSILAISFWIKLFFIITEVGLAIGFAVCSKQDYYNTAAILEWIVAFIFCIYVGSFFIDFLPALQTRHHKTKQTEKQALEEGVTPLRTTGDGAADNPQYYRGAPASTVPQVNGAANGYTNGYSDGYTNGGGYTNGTGYTNGNGYTNGHVDGYANGHNGSYGLPVSHDANGYPKPAEPAPLASRNF
ncbi:hypothetical protein NX059_007408 [Plenodomus lindquistii]|nr:hypothetical protein NX059_007408 [Plenodomus lindquistii]